MASPRILILTDGKMGDLVQCRGVALALTDTEKITERVIAPSSFYALPLPFMPVQKSDQRGAKNSPYNDPLPDMVIASGRRTLPYLRLFKRLLNKGSHAPPPFTVFLKNPRYHYQDIDFIWAPSHDGLKGDNIYSTDTSPHPLSLVRQQQASQRAKERFDALSCPCIGLILGGDSKNIRFDGPLIQQFIDQLLPLPAASSVLVTPSRRSPIALVNAVREALKPYPHWIWDGEGDNPYLEILSHCQRVVITGDSHNMVSEVLSLNKPVHVFCPPQLPQKLKIFLQNMMQQGALHDLKNGFNPSTFLKIDATPDIADKIMQRYKNAHL